MNKPDSYIGSWIFELKSQKKWWSEGLFDLTRKNEAYLIDDIDIEKIKHFIQLTLEDLQEKYLFIHWTSHPPEISSSFFLRFLPKKDEIGKIYLIEIEVYKKINIQELLEDPGSPLFIFKSIFKDHPNQFAIYNIRGELLDQEIKNIDTHQPIKSCDVLVQQLFDKVKRSKRLGSVQINPSNSAQPKTILCIFEPILNKNQEIIYLYNYNFDITDFQKKEDVIFNQFLALEAAMDGIALINEQGKFQYVNPRFSEIFGLAKNNTLLQQQWTQLPGVVNKQIFNDIIPTALQKAGKWFGEVQLNNPSSLSNYIEISLNNLPNNGMVFICRDISLRKEQEQQLELDHRILTHTNSIVVITNASLQIEWANSAFSKISGYPLEEVIGKKPGAFLQGPDTDKETIRFISSQIKAQQPFNCEILNYTKTGKPYWIEIKCQPLFNAAGVLEKFFAIEEDITFRKQTLLEIQKSEQRLNFALEGSNNGIWDWNIANNKVYYSTQWKRMLGYEENEINDSIDVFKNHLHPDDLNRVMKTLDDYLQKLTPKYECEFRLKDKFGQYHYRLDRGAVIDWDENGRPARMIGSNIDITPIVEANEKIKISEQRLEQALEASGNGVWDWNLETDETIYSKQWARMLGYEPHEISATAAECRNRIHPEDHPICKKALDDYLAGKVPYYECQQRLRSKDGTYIWTIDRGIVVDRDPSGKPKRVIGTNINITALKHAENQLRISEDRWRRAMEGTGASIAEINLSNGSIWYSQNTYLLLGYESNAEFPSNLSWLVARIHPDDKQELHQKFISHLKKNTPYFFCESRLRCKDGVFKWFSFQGRASSYNEKGFATQFIGSADNIHDRKVFEEKLFESEERWQTAIEGSGAGIWEIDLSNKQIWFSPRVIEMLGYMDADAMNHSLDSFLGKIHPDDLKDAIKMMEDHFKGLTKHFIKELRIRNNNGIYYWYALHGVVAKRNEEGTPLKFIGSCYDISDRKEFEKKLIISEERWKRAIEGSGAGIGEINLIERKIWYSQKAAQLLGYDHAEEIPDSLDYYISLIHPEDVEQSIRKLEDHLEGKTTSFQHEYRIRCKDGRFKWFDFHGLVTYRNSKGSPITFIGSAYDITDRKEFESKLKLTEERWKFAIDGAEAGVWDWDLTNDRIYYSDKAKEMHGINSTDHYFNGSEIITKSFHPEDRIRVLDCTNDLINNVKDKIEMEYRIQNGTGQYRWINDRAMVVSRNQKGNATRIIGIFNDINDQKILQTKLVESEERWIFALEGSSSGVWDYNLTTKDVFYSKKLKELLGYFPEDPFPATNLNTWDRLTHPDDQEKSREALKKYFQGNSPSFEIEQRIKHKDGQYRWFLNQGIIVSRDSQGEVSRIIGTATDITQRKKAELELIRAKEMAEISSKTKRAFLANMSHEIRTPMNAILGLSEQLKQTVLNKDQQFLTDIISDAAKNLQVLIDDILDFSKIEEGKLKLEKIPFDLHDLLNRNVNMLLHKAQEKNISLRLDYSSSIHDSIKGDPNRLNQILINIIGNAIKFTSKGYVILTCSLLQHNNKEQWVKFSIKDTGIGISEEGLKNIFSEFYQEDQSIARKFGGTGLGLAISYNLVQMMGGKIRIDSKKHSGTTVDIEIPFEISSQKIISKKIEETIIEKDKLKNKHILLVEDNKVNCIVATIILKKYGIEVDEAENGKVALDFLEHKNYDLILMDLQMPEMDGITAVRKLRQMNIDTPVIALTANAVREELEELIPIGFNDYIIKPFEESVLMKKIQKYTHMPITKQVYMPSDQAIAKINVESLKQLLHKNAGENPVLAETLTNAMKSELKTSIESLEHALQQDDVAAIKRIAHKQKSMFLSLGLSDECDCLMELSRLDLEKYNPVKTKALSLKMLEFFERTYSYCEALTPA